MARINLPPLTRALLLTVLALSTLNAVLRTRKWTLSLTRTPHALAATNYLTSPQWAVPYLVAIPLQSLRYPWTLLTGALIENNAVSLAVSGCVIYFVGRYLERAWGSNEYGKFILFVTVVPNVVTFFLYGFWHAVTGHTPEFPTPLNGLVALEAGFLVSLKQLVPEHTVSLFRGVIRMRVKHFPAVFVLANILSGPLLGTDTALWLSLFGFLTAWIHLRFFRISELGATAATGGPTVRIQGDASDTFAFVAFFPDVVHPYLSPVCDALHAALVTLGACTPFSDEAIEMGNESAASRAEGLPNIMDGRGGGSGGGGGVRRAEAERRRALALKALDQRLSAAAAGGGRGGAAGATGHSSVTNVQVSLNVDAPREPPTPSEVEAKGAPPARG